MTQTTSWKSESSPGSVTLILEGVCYFCRFVFLRFPGFCSHETPPHQTVVDMYACDGIALQCRYYMIDGTLRLGEERYFSLSLINTKQHYVAVSNNNNNNNNNNNQSMEKKVVGRSWLWIKLRQIHLKCECLHRRKTLADTQSPPNTTDSSRHGGGY